jgi:hypothetical protein
MILLSLYLHFAGFFIFSLVYLGIIQFCVQCLFLFSFILFFFGNKTTTPRLVFGECVRNFLLKPF